MSSAESAGSVASGRRPASTASMSSLWLSVGEIGADRQIDRVVLAVVLVQLDARRHQPDRGRRGPAGLARTGSGPGRSAGCWRRSGRWRRWAAAKPEVAQRAGHLAGLTALAAGVEHPDLGVGELGRGHVDHRRAATTCSPSLGAAGSRRCRAAALHAAASPHVDRSGQRESPTTSAVTTARTATSDDARADSCAGGTGCPCLVEGRAFGDVQRPRVHCRGTRYCGTLGRGHGRGGAARM